MSRIDFTLPESVVQVIEQTGSPSAGLRKLTQMRGLLPVAPMFEATFSEVAKRDRLKQFCVTFAPQVEAAKAAHTGTPAQTPTTRKPKATRQSEKEVSMTRSMEQRLEALENLLTALVGEQEPKAAAPKATTRKPAARKAAPKVEAKSSDKANVFTAKVVQSFGLPTTKGAKFTWKGKKGTTKWIVAAAKRDGSIAAVRAA